MNQLVDRALPLIVRQFAELQFCGLNDAGDGAPGQNDAVVSVAGVLLLLDFVVGGHTGGDLVGFFARPAVYFFFVHHSFDGLLFQGIVLRLEFVGAQLGRFGDLPGAGKLVLDILGAGLGLVCTVLLLRGFQAQPVAVLGGADLVARALSRSASAFSARAFSRSA